ncbi:MAG: hypothetical protein L3K17_09385 [Thermoplasmata archaeon]|nr:hypothetical protein [Thermoplasmata archaeon]
MKADTLRRLRGYKAGGASFDQVLNDLMDEIPPAGFIQEHLRRLREEETVDWDRVKAQLKL